MSRVLPFFRRAPRRCLGEDELSRLIAGALPEENLAGLQFHLAECPRCREELAGVMRLLHPDGEVAAEELPEPTEAEIAESYELVRRVALGEGLPDASANRTLAFLAGIAAAAVLLVAGALGWEHIRAGRSSQRFLAAAIAELEPVYADSSPSGLRLDLPFRPGAVRRSPPGREALERSENLFYQALSLRGELREAHLGLGAVYLEKSEFARARSEFDKVLQAGAGDLQALLGRGVAGYEEALANGDPAARAALARQALSDFESVLARDGRSLAARYNRIRILYDTGRHREALAGIESYLALDDFSIWAARLRDLKRRMELARPEAADEEAERDAAAGNRAGLEALVRPAPDWIPGTMQHVLRLGLGPEGPFCRLPFAGMRDGRGSYPAGRRALARHFA